MQITLQDLSRLTNITNDDPTQYYYHASRLGEEVCYPDCYFPIPMGDFGDGFYLSDNEILSYIWGSSSKKEVDPCLNTYLISPEIKYLRKCIIDPYNDNDLLFWASNVAYARINNFDPNESEQLNTAIKQIERLYYKYSVPRLNDYDWIISKRSDDGTNYFIPDFFGGTVTIDAIRDVYLNLSFGNQLVIKTKDSEQLISFLSSSIYNKTPYQDKYDEWKQSCTNEYIHRICTAYSCFQTIERTCYAF